MSSVDAIFRTITDADWRRSIKRSRARVNQVSRQIRQALSPIAVQQPNSTRGGDVTSVNGAAIGGIPHSCAVGSATAGRDRRNF